MQNASPIKNHTRPHANLQRWRKAAIPNEHGGWSIVSEPLLLGWLVGFSWAGFSFGLATFSAFLIRHPLKLLLKDAVNRRWLPRTQAALVMTTIYSSIGLMTFITALWLAQDIRMLWPLVIAAPFALVQLVMDAKNKSRTALAEIAGALAIGSSATVIGLLGGLSAQTALMLWIILALKSISTLYYIRSRLRLERGQPAARAFTVTIQAVVVLLCGLLTIYNYIPILALIAMSILGLRAVFGLSTYRTPQPAKQIGFQEMGYALLTVIFTAIGFVLI